MELIEQNESCTEMKRDCKAKGKESLTRGEERGRARRVRRGETDGGGKQRHVETKEERRRRWGAKTRRYEYMYMREGREH